MKALTEMISKRAQQAIAEKVFPGCVIGLIRAPRPAGAFGEGGNGSMEIIPVGTLAYSDDQEVKPDTIYDIASITKSIPTASLALTVPAMAFIGQAALLGLFAWVFYESRSNQRFGKLHIHLPSDF